MAKRRSPSTASDAGVSNAPARSKAAKPPTPRRAATAAPARRRAPELMTGPNEDAIRFRAYFRYLERGCLDGHALDDWLYAERELKNDR